MKIAHETQPQPSSGASFSASPSRMRSFIHAMFAFLIIAIPPPILILGRIYLEFPNEATFRRTIGFLLLFYIITLAVVIFFGLIALAFLMATKMFTQRNSCVAGWIVAVALSFPSGHVGIEQVVTICLMMLYGALSGLLFWRLWARGRRPKVID